MINLLVKIIDSVIIVIRVVRLIAGCIFIFVRISLFFKWPLRILGGFTWRLQKSLQFVIVRCWLILFFLSFRAPRGYGVKLTYLMEISFINLKGHRIRTTTCCLMPRVTTICLSRCCKNGRLYSQLCGYFFDGTWWSFVGDLKDELFFEYLYGSFLVGNNEGTDLQVSTDYFSLN